MSYDLDLYTARPPDLQAPDPGPGANFAIEPPAKAEDEDIPDSYLPLLGKRRRWLTRLHIEGVPSDLALATFDAWLATAIADTEGVLIDEQAGRYQTVRTDAALPDDTAAVPEMLGSMSFFFEDVETFHATGLARVLSVIADTLPEAMPTRWGRWEPLQGKVENGDTSGLLADFAEDPDLFFKANTPFAHIYLSLACEAELAKWHPTHRIRDEFLADCLSFELRPPALDDRRLTDLLAGIAVATGAFYAEIRDHDCPVSSWFWYGLPRGPVRAFVLGPPYTALWPEAAAKGTAIAPGQMLVKPTRFATDLPEPPVNLADPGEDRQPGATEQQKYAPTFPFEVPDRR